MSATFPTEPTPITRYKYIDGQITHRKLVSFISSLEGFNKVHRWRSKDVDLMFQQLLAEHLDSSATLAAYASIRPLGDWKLDISVNYVGHDFFWGGGMMKLHGSVDILTF